MKVAVIRGGVSSEHDVSLRSGASVADGLAEAGHQVERITIERDGAWVHEGGGPLALTPAGGLLGCDAAFPVLHGPGGEDGSVQGLLDSLGVPYVGSDVRLGALPGQARLQAGARRRGAAAGELRRRERGSRRPRRRHRPGLARPRRVPGGAAVGEAGAPGIERRHQQGGVRRRAGRRRRAARRHDPKVIVEATGPGREVECSVLGHAE